MYSTCSAIELTAEERTVILTEMLEKLSCFLGANSIPWYMAYGSLLGTIRHSGFIPWDDDIDIVIPRDNYIRLIHLLDKEEKELLNSHLTLIPYSSGVPEGSYYLRLKIADDRTFVIENGVKRPGLFIDIFPLDALPSINRYRFYNRLILGIANLCDLCNSKGIVKETNRYKKDVYKVIWFLCRVIGGDKALKCLENLLIRNNRKYMNDYWFDAGYGQRDCAPARCYRDTLCMQFEGINVPVPSGYDEILTNYYGDYMTLPPIEQRKGHDNFTVYWV